MKKKKPMPTIWEVSDELWNRIEPLILEFDPPKETGRPRINPRNVLDALIFRIRTGCQWKALPREYGSGSTVHRYFQEWTEQGVFGKAWRRMLMRYDQRRGIGWNWQSVDGSMTKAPLGGEKNRQKPYRSR